MPPLKDVLAKVTDLPPALPVPAENKPPASQDSRVDSLLKSPYQRCPLPSSNNSADSLRQWGQGSDVPKFRTQTPPSNISGGSSGGSSVSLGSSSSSSTTTIIENNPAPAQSVGITTPSLAPSAIWKGIVQMAKGFQVLTVATSSFARVELYGTKSAQTLDQSRPVTMAPSNTTQGLIMDVVLLTSLRWQVLDCVGANGDNQQTPSIYITVTNVSTAAQPFTVTLTFVPLES